MDQRDWQARIDAIEWYHEFDFGNGLKATTKHDTEFHRQVWQFIDSQLGAIDFRGKTVLDIGCWDGYWSFYAERRGAKSVLASDDCTQNWSSGQGLLLAKELLHSRIEVNQALPIYELSSLGRRFDIILCLGVYYHLLDPFHAFAQIRHCCHSDTVVVLEGDGIDGPRPDTILFNLSDHSKPIFLPTPQALQHLVQACYLSVTAQTWWPQREEQPHRAGRLGWRWRLRMCAQALAGSRPGIAALARQIEPPSASLNRLAPLVNRLVTVCKPFQGTNPAHHYKPPFGLHIYDDRFRQLRQAA
jgi:tRNA (mo5U34)-methyltransferase